AGFLVGCAPMVKPTARQVEIPSVEKAGQVQLRQWTYGALVGWTDDRHGEALVALQKSCALVAKRSASRLMADNPNAPGGTVGEWKQACDIAASVDPSNHEAARHYFEMYFTPYEVRDAANPDAPQTGLFTGYYEPELNGTWKQGGKYQTPLLARPSDLVSANIGQFDAELGGSTIWGRVVDGKLVPYPDRKTIESGGLGSKAKPLLWVDSPVDAFFLHVQGSGQVRLADGSVRHVGFAGKNGLPYKSIGRVLIDRGEIPAEQLTMDAIRNWIDARPLEGQKLIEQNPSYVFFRMLEGDGPLGAQGVALTPGRSLAVDRRYLPMGAPLWMETHEPLDGAKEMNRLMVSQDTGGAIKGVVRGDIFFGAGQEATRRAGNMKRPGRYFILLPNGVTP
ncbi:MAG TPA: murein transglycosylase A, partial [Magnetovibrio sp.]